MNQLQKIANWKQRGVGAFGGAVGGGVLGTAGGSMYGLGRAAMSNRGKDLKDRKSLADAAVQGGLVGGAIGSGIGVVSGGAMGPKAFTTLKNSVNTAKEDMGNARAEWVQQSARAGVHGIQQGMKDSIRDFFRIGKK